MLSAHFKSIPADIFQWRLKSTPGRNSSVILTQYWPPYIEENLIEKMKYIMTSDLPADYYFPLKRLYFQGHTVNVPNRYMEVIKFRYPYSWWWHVPYKWRCYIGF